jgi:hypothetical protein
VTDELAARRAARDARQAEIDEIDAASWALYDERDLELEAALEEVAKQYPANTPGPKPAE